MRRRAWRATSGPSSSRREPSATWCSTRARCAPAHGAGGGTAAWTANTLVPVGDVKERQQWVGQPGWRAKPGGAACTAGAGICTSALTHHGTASPWRAEAFEGRRAKYVEHHQASGHVRSHDPMFFGPHMQLHHQHNMTPGGKQGGVGCLGKCSAEGQFLVGLPACFQWLPAGHQCGAPQLC